MLSIFRCDCKKKILGEKPKRKVVVGTGSREVALYPALKEGPCITPTLQAVKISPARKVLGLQLAFAACSNPWGSFAEENSSPWANRY